MGGDTPRIRAIRFTGERSVGDLQLLDLLALKPGSPFSFGQVAQDSSALLRFYRAKGFYLAEVRPEPPVYSPDSASVDITFRIREGESFRIGRIDIEGAGALAPDAILEKFDTRPGTILSQAVLEADIDALLSRYDRLGYPFTRVEVTAIRPVMRNSNEELDIGMRIDEGQRLTIEEIRVEGNSETKSDVVTRETGIRLHEVYDAEKVAAIRNRLSRMNIFASVSEPELYVGPQGGGLLIRVQEQNTNSFDGILGYAPARVEGESGLLTGMVNISMRNLFGTARKASLQWLQDERDAQEIAVRYLEPWVLGLPVNLSGGLSQRRQDTTYVRRTLDARADLLLTGSLTLGGTLTHETVIPSGITGPLAVSASSTTTSGLVIRYDTRDDPASPTGGIEYQTGYQIGRKKISAPSGAAPGPGSSTVQRISVDLELYLSPFARQVIAEGIHARGISADVIEAGDLYRFGGTRTLRGYREDQFLGSRISWINSEYRFLLGPRSYVAGFVDGGYYFVPENRSTGSASQQFFKVGYGIGVQMETALGIIGTSFALGEGDSFLEGKVHIGLMNQF